jgi:ketosteroid isomerase-like protein
MKNSTRIMATTCLLVLPAAVVAAAADVEVLKQELMAVDAAFSRHSAEHGMAAAFHAYAAEDAFKFEPGVGVLKGREAINRANADVPAGFVLTWTPLSAEAAASGDMGYTFGRYESRRRLPDGTERRSSGHYMTLWRRQADGSWKWVFDTGVPDPAPATEP